MTVVYIDALFLLNLVTNYFLLLASAKLAGEVIHRLRLAAGAAAGAIYACLLFLPGMGFLVHPLSKLCVAVIMVLLAFGGSRRLLRLVIVFFCLSFALAGGVLAIGLMGGKGLSLKNGVLYSAMDVKMIALSAAGCYVIFTAVFPRVAKQVKGREVLPAVLRYGERKVTLLVLVDTGNTLSDPVTGRPVLVANFENVAPLIPPGVSLIAGDLSDPVKTLQRLAEQGVGNSFRLLPYQAVGVECGLLLALRLDNARVGTRDYGPILAALSPNRVSDGGGYSGLVGT